MSGILGNLVFLNPWILAGFAGLPLLWYLLRVTPPAARLVFLPTARFLEGLIPETQISSHTPWWVMLLRILTVALILVGLAHPVYDPADALPETPGIRLVIDNGWAAAQTWEDQVRAAEDILARAGREKKEIYILTTANAPGKTAPESYGPLSYAQASSILKGLKPRPWPAYYDQVASYVRENASRTKIYSFWLSHGLDEGGFSSFAKTIETQGGLSIFSPAAENLPVLLARPSKESFKLDARIISPAAIPAGKEITLQALSETGRILARQTIRLNAGNPESHIPFDIPDTLTNELTRIKIEGRRGAGALYMLDARNQKRTIGIMGPGGETETKPFIDDIYYLKRALEPYANLKMGNIENILKSKPSMIILPDIGTMPAETLSILEQWVRNGGLLLRFAGPKMLQGESSSFLVPVKLRAGGRSMQGALTWGNPVKLSPFSESSPFYGLEIPEDITVRRQILAEPDPDLAQKTWAALEDGTPLITAASLDRGLLVMIHTTASPAWSDFALSGIYVEILRRLSAMAGHTNVQTAKAEGILQPLNLIDGFGESQAPESWMKSIPANVFDKTMPNSLHPPGIYGRGALRQTLNLGDHIETLKTPAALPRVKFMTYGAHYERDFLAAFLFSALGLFLLDWLIMINIRSLASFIFLALCVAAPSAYAGTPEDIKYADGLYLAYIRTGDETIDSISRRGLENLAQVLKNRTSAEPEGVAALDPAYDNLSFFPLIYWPMSERQQTLSHEALKNVQYYIDHGGTILFDLREPGASVSFPAESQKAEALKRVIGALDTPPLEPIKKDHVLTRSFYLLDTFPGFYSSDTLWVESGSVKGRDGVSSILIGANDWASAWAAEGTERTLLSGGTRAQELSYRFGVNAVIYALTGNYKADQVHVPYILERLGQ